VGRFQEAHGQSMRFGGIHAPLDCIPTTQLAQVRCVRIASRASKLGLIQSAVTRSAAPGPRSAPTSLDGESGSSRFRDRRARLGGGARGGECYSRRGRSKPTAPHRRVPGENVDGVPPFLGQRMLPYRCNGDVTVDTILVARIARRYREVRKDDISGRVALATTAFPSSGSVSRRLWKRPDAT
jgi:hypothetical protein